MEILNFEVSPIQLTISPINVMHLLVEKHCLMQWICYCHEPFRELIVLICYYVAGI
jgi:hypothetical protein